MSESASRPSILTTSTAIRYAPLQNNRVWVAGLGWGTCWPSADGYTVYVAQPIFEPPSSATEVE